jgi:4-hydroxythreonine-4-phosphate dehydrogenase
MSNITSMTPTPEGGADGITTLALTAGEPGGIGPDLCAYLALESLPARIILIADREMMHLRSEMLGIKSDIPDYIPGSDVAPGVFLLHQSLPVTAAPGKLDPANSGAIIKSIERAVRGCVSGEFDALVTAPVHKGAINAAGMRFSGHTEFLAELTGTEHVVMMLTGGGMRVALATTHLPLREVPDAITKQSLERTLRILHSDLKMRFGLDSPRIAVAGLNPHAGESGYLGREELDVIAPTLEALEREGMRLAGPLPADTLFNPDILANFDAVLAMYHDQGLPVLKYASFGEGVNITLGLPIIRTSVDHGTALTLAGTGKINRGSLKAAIDTAIEMVERSR